MTFRVVVLLAPAALFATSACELREITLATPDNVVVAEVVLRAGAVSQTAYLHRTSTGEGSARVFGAHIRVTDAEDGSSFIMDVRPDEACLDPVPPADHPGTGTCYGAEAPEPLILPGRTYTLRIELGDGGVLTGSTAVPGEFEVMRPGTEACRLAARENYELTWTLSEGTSIYLIEAQMAGLREALRRAGIDVPGAGTVELLGFSVTAQDTTLVFPSELGLFDRLDEDLHPILIAIRGGLPPGVTTMGSVTAADRNYVNWVRGGNFNPSGPVRISSLRGDGIGVFGSLVTRTFDMVTDAEGEVSELPVCP
jgi:hypothetical protein